jgi:hypothetical protein
VGLSVRASPTMAARTGCRQSEGNR